MNIRHLPLIIFTAISLAAFAGDDKNDSTDKDLWGDDSWGEEIVDASPWLWSGFVEAGFGQFTQDNVTRSKQSLYELRGQLEFSYNNDWLKLNAKTDVLLDDVTEQSEVDLRELNATISALASTDVIVGRQVITWGTGDYLFLNDLFAKDWQSFFAGRDDGYLKAPNDALRVLHYWSELTLDLVYAPEFTPDNYLTGERFSFYSPFEQGITAPERFPVTTTSQEQISLRLATSINGTELALYCYKGFWTTPVGVKTQGPDAGKSYFPKLNSYGASARTAAFGGLFNAEVAIYNSIEDTSGDNPFIANGQTRLLLGYERELTAGLTGSVQYYLEHTKDYHALRENAADAETLVSENRQLLTLRLTHSALQQRLMSRLFLFYSPTDKDAYLKPSVSYRYSDQWQFSGGANVFVGKHQYSFFGQHEDNSNLWLRVRYNY